MNNEPVAWMQTWENQDGELKRTVNIEQIGKQDIPLYTHPVKELTTAEIECLKEVNAKQVDYITQQKYAYEKLWKEHMELFWKHEQDTDLTNE